MSKELIPLRVEDIPELDKINSQQLYTPIVPKPVTEKIEKYKNGSDTKTVSLNFSVGATTLMAPFLTGGIIGNPILAVVGVAIFGAGIIGVIIAYAFGYNPGQKKRDKKYKPIYDAILEKNFQAFLNWAKTRYNVIVDVESIPEQNLKNLKLTFSGLCSLENRFAWVKDTMGKTYLIRQNNEKEYYLVEETNDEMPTTVILTEVKNSDANRAGKDVELFVGETQSLWNALQSRLVTVENFGLSVENAHVIQRIQNDCTELTSNIYKLSKLNTKPDFDELEKALIGLNQEVQDVIDDEATQVKKEITKTTDWIAVRNLQINKDLTADELAVLPTLLLRNEGQQK